MQSNETLRSPMYHLPIRIKKVCRFSLKFKHIIIPAIPGVLFSEVRNLFDETVISRNLFDETVISIIEISLEILLIFTNDCLKSRDKTDPVPGECTLNCLKQIKVTVTGAHRNSERRS